ncbi:MAG: hypothetical protein ISS19_10315 [Bacteroidales bacterium]|nr:hypothetical protein [Bacteroidales bacterium]
MKNSLHINRLLPFIKLINLGLFLLACSSQVIHSQDIKDDSLFHFTARIIDRGINEPVQFAHIINQTRGYASISDTMGYFRIGAARNDLLKLTAIGYYDCPFHLNDSILSNPGVITINMIQRAYPIQAVNVNQLGTYTQFKHKFLNLDIPEPKIKANPSVIKDIEMGADSVYVTENISLGSPITAIYMALSKEGKSLRKYAKIKEEEQFQEKVADKYNREILEEVTGMTGPELHDFLQFCDLDKNFILGATAYEILEALYKCLEEYKKNK